MEHRFSVLRLAWPVLSILALYNFALPLWADDTCAPPDTSGEPPAELFFQVDERRHEPVIDRLPTQFNLARWDNQPSAIRDGATTDVWYCGGTSPGNGDSVQGALRRWLDGAHRPGHADGRHPSSLATRQSAHLLAFDRSAQPSGDHEWPGALFDVLRMRPTTLGSPHQHVARGIYADLRRVQRRR